METGTEISALVLYYLVARFSNMVILFQCCKGLQLLPHHFCTV